MRGRLLLGVAVAVVVAAVGTVALVSGDAEEGVACPPLDENPEWSAARRWNEATLNAIRRDLPAPTVHARNLFHTSAAMWDAWAAFDPPSGRRLSGDGTRRMLGA